ncbi:hypothetical protein DEJ20_07960 [Curtobacterium sp. MCSS17_005]|nr:hypothetical protein [Curtobacterium sp. MCSS17_005]WIB34389.1 hypothetical protein DEJ20_07960 [Curtobacterium sp. MCSS17_005]
MTRPVQLNELDRALPGELQHLPVLHALVDAVNPQHDGSADG